MRKLSLLIISLLITCIATVAMPDEGLASRFDRMLYEFPQEKIHVMTDRDHYMAGDTIWLRAWVVDASTHRPVDASAFINIELTNPLDSLERRIKINQANDGVFKGYIALYPEMGEGIYQLTAYTMFLQNVGENYFFKKPLTISSIVSMRKRIESKMVRYGDEIDVTLRYLNAGDSTECDYKNFCYLGADGTLKGFAHDDDDVHFTLKNQDARLKSLLVIFDNYAKFLPLPEPESFNVSFYPEGGYMIGDVENKVTFKVEGSLPTAEQGELIDSLGNVVSLLNVEHDGMGMIEFTPKNNMKYTARWHDKFDKTLDFQLPLARNDATVVRVQMKDTATVCIKAVGAHCSETMIVVQQRGRLVAAGRDSLLLNKDSISEGVIQAMLFDHKWRCLSERLFFVRHNHAPQAQILTDKPVYSDRERIQVNLDLKDFERNMAHCAVSVTDDATSSYISGVNILTNLLVQSDLKGYINNPEYYFKATDDKEKQERERHLDMLMLTQGWRRYDIPALMRGYVFSPEYPIEKSQVITGRVLSEWRKVPLAGATVNAIAPQVSFSTMVVTDSLGQFIINLPLMPENAVCLIMAENKKGKKQMNLEPDQESFPELHHEVGQMSNEKEIENKVQQQSWRLEKSDDWRHVMLGELLVTAPLTRRNTSEYNPYVLSENEMKRKEINSIEGAVRNFPGLMVMNGNVYTTGGQERDHVSIIVDGENIAANYSSDDDILFQMFKDDVSPFEPKKQSSVFYPLDRDAMIKANISEISIAESMISFPDVAWIDFVRANGGHGGLLIIQQKENSRRGKEKPSIYMKIVRPLGVQQPAEFYSPRYDHGSQNDITPAGTDLRSVLYWNPNIIVDNSGHTNFDFYASDAHNTTYNVVIEGVTESGQLIRATHRIKKN